MVGLGPKRKAPSLRAADPVDLRADDLDDIFVPEAPDVGPGPAHRGKPPQQRQDSEATGPASVRTRLILRRALLRQARAQRLLRASSASQLEPRFPPRQASPAADGTLRRGLWRRTSGLQLGVIAAVAGALCGTVLAYTVNDYMNGNRQAESLEAAKEEGAQNAASATLPQEIAEATAVEIPSDDDASRQEEPEPAEPTDPLPLPVSSAEPASAAKAQDNHDASAELQQTAAAENLPATSSLSESGDEAPEEDGTTVAAVDKSEQIAPSRPALVPSAVETFRDCEICPMMVKIPASRFSMGSPEKEDGRQDYEGPQRVVSLSRPFAIGQYEITIADWQACVSDGGCKRKIDDEGWGGGARPAINISWEEITGQYLPWLSRKTGHAYRLPSEAEWEFAARGAGEGQASTRFSFGDTESEICSYANGSDLTAKEQNGGGSGVECRDGYATTAPVGSFSPNQFGLFDMHGNVWEWVEDCWNETFDKGPTDGSAWKEGDCTNRVVRGGSFNSDAAKLRSAARGWNQPSGRNRSIGFRVLREL